MNDDPAKRVALAFNGSIEMHEAHLSERQLECIWTLTEDPEFAKLVVRFMVRHGAVKVEDVLR